MGPLKRGVESVPVRGASMTPSTHELALERVSWQSLVFAERLGRSALLRIRSQVGARSLTIRIHRNFPVEFLITPLKSFLAFSGYAAEARLGAYDDALSFAEAGDADVELVWMDLVRYRERMTTQGLAVWLAERVLDLRTRTRVPILVGGGEPPMDISFDVALQSALTQIPGARIVPRYFLTQELGESYWDNRLKGLGATRISDAANLAQARELGLVWIPAALEPRLKALAVDLDGTLYQGVIGEDGAKGLVITEAHVQLQRRILALKEEGLFLALVSRNEPVDVEALFEARPDFPLRREHFSAFEVSWGPKSDAVVRVAARLCIATDAILFIDDNIGELGAMALAQPSVRLLAAGDPSETLRGLGWYPGLTRWTEGSSDALRAIDLAANEVRTALASEAVDPKAYLRSLQVRLNFALDPTDQRARLAELSGKTNQFNLSLRRLTEVDVAKRIADTECAAVTAALSDRLSDSGVILGIFAKREGETLIIEDLCISCRALGRNLEDTMIVEAVNRILSRLPARRVAFEYTLGPRNAPAREWLSRFAGVDLENSGRLELDWDREARSRQIKELSVDCNWK